MNTFDIFKSAQNGCVNYFLQNIQDSNFKKILKNTSHSKSGDTVLHYAARYGHLKLMTFLVSEGLDIEIANFDGKRPIHEAAQFGHVNCIECLIKRGAKVDCLKRADWTPLMLACTKVDLNVVKILLDNGAIPHLQNKDGWNSFHIATREGHLPIISHLLRYDGTLWDTVSKNGRTPLHTAALHGHTDVVDYLLGVCDYRTDVKDSCGTTPLMDAFRRNSIDIASLLIQKHKADVAVEDNLGRQCLHISAQAGATQSVEYLTQQCAVKPDCLTSGTRVSALHIAAKEGHSEVLLLLLSNDVAVNICDQRGRTALHIAAGGQHVDCARILLQHGSMCKPDHDGTTPQQLARKPDLVQLFTLFETTGT